MSASLGNKLRSLVGKFFAIIGESSWVVFAFILVSLLVGWAISSLPFMDNLVETTVGQLLFGGIIYALITALVVLPLWIRGRRKRVAETLGLTEKVQEDILWKPFIFWGMYMVATIFVGAMLSSMESIMPWFDPDQEQDVGFTNLTHVYEYVLAFIGLVVLPPVFEELLFRGYLFGRLRKKVGFITTTIVVSLVFGLVHMQWNVGFDVAVLSVFLCILREQTGSVWYGVVLHAIKNGLAYFLLFIAPLLGWQMLQ